MTFKSLTTALTDNQKDLKKYEKLSDEIMQENSKLNQLVRHAFTVEGASEETIDFQKFAFFALILCKEPLLLNIKRKAKVFYDLLNPD